MNAHAEDIQRQEVDQSDHLAEQQMMRDLKRYSHLRAQVVAVESRRNKLQDQRKVLEAKLQVFLLGAFMD